MLRGSSCAGTLSLLAPCFSHHGFFLCCQYSGCAVELVHPWTFRGDWCKNHPVQAFFQLGTVQELVLGAGVWEVTQNWGVTSSGHYPAGWGGARLGWGGETLLLGRFCFWAPRCHNGTQRHHPKWLGREDLLKLLEKLPKWSKAPKCCLLSFFKLYFNFSFFFLLSADLKISQHCRKLWAWTVIWEKNWWMCGFCLFQSWLVLFVPMKCLMNSFCHKLPTTSIPQWGLENHQSRAADAGRRASKREESWHFPWI